MERFGTHPLAARRESTGRERGEARADDWVKVLGCVRRKDIGRESHLPRKDFVWF